MISTLKRPVPLEYNLYVNKELYKIVDARREFLNDGYRCRWHETGNPRANVPWDLMRGGTHRFFVVCCMQVLQGCPGQERRQEASGAGAAPDRPRRRRPPAIVRSCWNGSRAPAAQRATGACVRVVAHACASAELKLLAPPTPNPSLPVSPPQERTHWVTLVDFLRKRSLLPVVAFTFSKRRCESNAAALANIELTTGSERSEIQVFVDQSLKRLKGSCSEGSRGSGHARAVSIDLVSRVL